MSWERPINVDTKDVASALDTPESQAEFMVITDDDVLEACSRRPWSNGGCFCTPANGAWWRDWNGPVRVLGGAGTGKTVVAMHKARWLAAQLISSGTPGRCCSPRSRAIWPQTSAANLTKICTPEELQRIEVQHLDGWVLQFLKAKAYRHAS